MVVVGGGDGDGDGDGCNIFFFFFNGSALLSGTLRTYQRAGCDDEMVTLRCPPGTGISIDFAHYGKTAPVVCNSKTTQASIISGSYNYNVSCVWQSAAQVCTKQIKAIFVQKHSAANAVNFPIVLYFTR